MKRASPWMKRRDGSYQRLDATRPPRSVRRDRRRILAHVVLVDRGFAWTTHGEHGVALSIGSAQFWADEALRRAGWTFNDLSDAAAAGAGAVR